jgi:hypothetical protein
VYYKNILWYNIRKNVHNTTHEQSNLIKKEILK